MGTNKFCVIGLGYFGSNLAIKLTEYGAEVLAIDKDMEKVEEIADKVTIAVQLDATDKNALKSQDLSDFDAVIVAIGEGFESSITTTAILQEIGVKVIYNRIISPLHQRLLSLMGIHNLLVPEAEAAEHLAKQLLNPGLIDAFPISNNFSIYVVYVPKKYINVSVIDSKIRQNYNLNLVTVKKTTNSQNQTKREIFGAETIGVPIPTYIFKENDVLVLFGSENDFLRFMKE
jgi:trk system potassium uptake protein TrkA